MIDYLESHNDSLREFTITKEDCSHVFCKVPYEKDNQVVREKWRLIGQCLSRVCSKRCTWWDLEVRATAANACDYTTVAEEAIVYWLFISEGNDWVHEFNIKNGDGNSPENDADTTSTAQRKKCGQHKTLQFLKHWWQLKVVVKSRRLNSGISQKLDEAWRIFAGEELQLKKNKNRGRKRTIQDVLPTFEDVLGIGESEGDYTSGGLEIEDDLELFVTQTSDV
jgi:hypothetical protein